MKKIRLVLTLVLSLCACILSFTSCNEDPHEHTWSFNYTVDKEATCTEPGQKSIKCIECNEIKEGTEVVIPASHKWGTEMTVDTPATCLADGSKSIKCTVCGESNPSTATKIPMTTHNWESVATVDVEATCTTDGQKSIKCTDCKGQKAGTVEVIPAGHDWDVLPTIDFEATCTSDGQESIKCKKCKTSHPDSVVTIPGGHNWETEATVDFAATCTTAGQKSVKCSTCKQSDPDTVEVIPASHDYSKVVVKTQATMFNDGLREGICGTCNTVISEVIPMTVPRILSFGSQGGTFKETIPFNSILKDNDHFYPTEENPDGNDLYVEYSILLNETMDAFVGTSWAIGGIRNQDSSKGNAPYWFYFSPDSKWCPYKGGFEADSGETLFGPSCNDVTNPDGFVVIDDYYGWHRFGLKLHQDTYIENGKVVYKIISTLYVDGVKVQEMVCSNWLEENNLYFASIVNGKLEYSDNTNSSKSLFIFRMEKAYTSDGSTAYVPIADLSVSYGDGFAIPVLPVASPENATYEIEDGVIVDGRTHFRLYDETDSTEHEHIWSNFATIDKIPNCIEDGQKSVKCAICGEIDTESIVIIPRNGNHSVESYETVLAATIFSEGLKRGNCSVCGEEDLKVVPMTTATERKLESDSPSWVVNNYSMEEVLGNKHFYPTEDDPDGKDLYIEMSFLWNESLLKTTGGVMAIGRISLGNASDGNGFYYLTFKDDVPGYDCGHSGGIESASRSEILTGPAMTPGGDASEFPFIGGYGWHRLGVRIHQDVVRDGNLITYKVTSYLYVDGVIVSSQICSVYDSNLLYYATVDAETDELVYSDNVSNSRYIYAYRLEGFNTASIDDTAFFITADVSVSCGNGFLVPVEKAETPTPSTYSTGGIDFDGTVYFDQLDVEMDIPDPEPEPGECTSHVDANDDCDCDNEGCDAIFSDGCDITDCLDTDDDGLCDNDGCDKITSNKPAGACVHKNVPYVKVPTLFSEGVKSGYCDDCDREVSLTVGKTTPTIHIVNKSHNGNNAPNYTVKIGDVIGDEVFNPTEEDEDGNDLYLEFSVLLTDELGRLSGPWFAFGGISENKDVAKAAIKHPFSYLYSKSDAKWCPFVGGMEFSEGGKYSLDGGATWKDYSTNNNNKEDFVIVGGYDGWHRIGLRYHQNFYEKNGTFTYDVTIYLYVDGVQVSQQIMNWGDLFYSVERVDGDLVYTQNEDITDLYGVFYRYANAYLAEGDDDVYIAFADCILSVGDDFVLDVAPVEKPSEDSFTQDGVTLPGKQYYELNIG